MKVFIRTEEKTTTITYKPGKRTNQITSRGVIENVGVCKVSYSSTEYNEFEFDGKEDFTSKFLPCVEPALLKFMGVIK
jgi:hypothetical protein